MLVCCLHSSADAKGVYQTTEQFISHVFKDEIPKAKVMWLSEEDKSIIEDIMSHSFNLLRIRYWQINSQTVWILDEIGKERPITIGVHIQNGKIVELKVLTFLESRGDEVRHEFFTSQFNSVKLNKENMLTQHIDGITGATMSVRALTKVARLSLWLSDKATQ